MDWLKADCLHTDRGAEYLGKVNVSATGTKPSFINKYRIVPNMRPYPNKRPPFFCLFSSSLVSFPRRFLLINNVFSMIFLHIFAFSLPFFNFNHIFYCFLLISIKIFANKQFFFKDFFHISCIFHNFLEFQ